MAVTGLVGRSAPPDHLEFSQQRLLITYGVLAGICSVVVACRIYVRAIKLKAFKWDDWIMVAAQIINIIALVFFTLSVRWGQGSHSVRAGAWAPILRWFIMYTLCVVVALGAAKLSVGFHLLRITRGLFFKRCLWTLNISLVVTTIVSIFVVLFECTDVRAKWYYWLRRPKGPAKCMPINTYTAINLTLNSVLLGTDIIFALLPIPVIWSLKIPMREKILLALILGLAFIACFAGILKMYFSTRAFAVNNPHAFNDMLRFYTWQIAECEIAIIAASLPTLRPLIRSLLGPSSSSQPVNDQPKQLMSPISPLSGESYIEISSDNKQQPETAISHNDLELQRTSPNREGFS